MAYLSRMKSRRFGRTELQMPVISCGGMRYQFKWQDVDANEVPRQNQENLEAIISHAVELGINHFETARGYGSAEKPLGDLLSAVPRDENIVKNKGAPHKKTKEFLKAFGESLNYLPRHLVEL